MRTIIVLQQFIHNGMVIYSELPTISYSYVPIIVIYMLLLQHIIIMYFKTQVICNKELFSLDY